MTNIDPILTQLLQNGRYTAAQLAELVALDEAEVAEKVKAWEADGTILGYQALIDREKTAYRGVIAFIEIKVKPVQEGGFDHVAKRISKFDQVRSLDLVSGTYDLLAVVEGEDLRDVALFVAKKLSTLDGVLSTGTSFQLRTYKQNGLLTRGSSDGTRLSVSP